LRALAPDRLTATRPALKTMWSGGMIAGIIDPASYRASFAIKRTRAVGGTNDDGYLAFRSLFRSPHDGPRGRYPGCCPGDVSGDLEIV
jgi:hypothetical protein